MQSFFAATEDCHNDLDFLRFNSMGISLPIKDVHKTVQTKKNKRFSKDHSKEETCDEWS